MRTDSGQITKQTFFCGEENLNGCLGKHEQLNHELPLPPALPPPRPQGRRQQGLPRSLRSPPFPQALPLPQLLKMAGGSGLWPDPASSSTDLSSSHPTKDGFVVLVSSPRKPGPAMPPPPPPPAMRPCGRRRRGPSLLALPSWQVAPPVSLVGRRGDGRRVLTLPLFSL